MRFTNAMGEWNLVAAKDPKFERVSPQSPLSPYRQFDEHKGLLAEMRLCRMVDNYLAYVTELLYLIFKTRPEMLKSGDKVSVKSVLEHQTMDAFVESMIERRVSSLSYMGLSYLQEYLEKQFGLSILGHANHAKVIIELVETRNLITHGRGIINRLFCSRVTGFDDRIGQHIAVDFRKTQDDLLILYFSAKILDAIAIHKFGLPTIPFEDVIPVSYATPSAPLPGAPS